MAYRPYQPDYYTRGNIPVWDFIRDQGLNFHLGNAIKYICRAGHKGPVREDLVKAIHYLENELENQPAECKGVPTSLSSDIWAEYAADPDILDR